MYKNIQNCNSRLKLIYFTILFNLFYSLLIFSQDSVILVDKGNYYYAVLDYNKGLNHRQIGEELALQINKTIPDYEKIIDSLLTEVIKTEKFYKEILLRMNDIKILLNQDIKDEIEGMASKFSGLNDNVLGDAKLSTDEFYIYNLIPDIVRATQCSFLSVFRSHSTTNKTITARSLDWYGGSQNQLPKLQTVTIIKYDKKWICLIGYLGFMGVITGFNDNGLYAAILDSSSGEPYSSKNKNSYTMDIRYALENFDTINETAKFLKDAKRNYTINHLIALSDSSISYILENNISKSKNSSDTIKRKIRKSNSILNKGISWKIKDSIGAVNSFMLYGNFDNFSNREHNTKRWENLKRELITNGNKTSNEDIKKIISFNHGKPGNFKTSGDIYNNLTQQIIIFNPDKLRLEIFFRPKNTLELPDKPIFEIIQLN